MLRNTEKKSTFKLVTSRSSICLVYYDQQSKRMQVLLCQDGYLKYQGKLVVDDREKLDKYEIYLEQQKKALRREKKKGAQSVTRALAAVDQIKRSLGARKKSEACSIRLDTFAAGEFAIDFLDQNSQSLKKMGPFPYQNGFAHLTLSVGKNWNKIGAFTITKKGKTLFFDQTSTFGPFQLTENVNPIAMIKNPIRSCRPAGQVEPKKLGVFGPSTERHYKIVDNRTVVENLMVNESDACVAKLRLEFAIVDDKGNTQRRFYQATGSIMNMKLENGSVSKCYIQTAAHVFLQVDALHGTKSYLVGCTAYLRRKGESNYDKEIPVQKYKVYDRYLELKQKDMKFQGVDFAIASIDLDPSEVAVKTFDSRFNTLPVDISDLNPVVKPIDIRVTGYSSHKKNQFQPLTMDGKITKVVKRKGDHALLVYNVDTSPGTEGAMLCWKQEGSGIGRNLGIHVGISDNRSYGLLLTQPIMNWMYETITSGEFWEGSYISPVQQPIGCWEPYDPYQTYKLEQEEEEVQAADVGERFDPYGTPDLTQKEDVITYVKFPQSEELSKVYEDAGYFMLSPVYEVQGPNNPDGNDKFELILPYIDVEDKLKDFFAELKWVKSHSDISVENAINIIANVPLIMDFVGRREIVLLHGDCHSKKPRLQVIPTYKKGYGKIGAIVSNFSRFTLVEPKDTAIASIYFDEGPRQLSAWVGESGYLEHEEIDTSQDTDKLTSYRELWDELFEQREANQNEIPKATFDLYFKAIEHAKNAHNAKLGVVRNSLPVNMLEYGLIELEFIDEDGETLEKTGQFRVKDDCLLQNNLLDLKSSKKIRKFKIHHYTKSRWQKLFGSLAVFSQLEHTEYGSYNVRNEYADEVNSPWPTSPTSTTRIHLIEKIDLLYLTFLPIESMFNYKSQELVYKDFASERMEIKKILSNDSHFYVDMFESVYTWDALLQNKHILHIAGDGKKDWMLLEDKRGESHDFNMDGTPKQNAKKILKKFHLREDSFKTQTSNTILVLYFTCYSQPCGEALLYLGIPHVICIKKGEEVKTKACEKFAKVFYKVLFDSGNITMAFTKAQNSLGEDGKVFMHLKDPSKDDNLENLTQILRMDHTNKLKIDIDNPVYNIPKSSEVGIFADGEDLHVSWKNAVHIVQDLQDHSCATIHGPVMCAQEQMAQIVAYQTHRLGHYQDGVFSVKFEERIYSLSAFIKATVDCIHESKVYTEEDVTFDERGRSLKKLVKDRCTILLFYAGQALYDNGEVDWLCDDPNVRKEIYRFLLALHEATKCKFPAQEGAICVCFTGKSYQEFKTFNKPINKFRQHAYQTDELIWHEEMATSLRTLLRDVKSADVSLPLSTNVLRRLQHLEMILAKKNGGRKVLTAVLDAFFHDIDAAFRESYLPDVANCLDNLSEAVKIRDQLYEYHCSKAKSPPVEVQHDCVSLDQKMEEDDEKSHHNYDEVEVQHDCVSLDQKMEEDDEWSYHDDDEVEVQHNCVSLEVEEDDERSHHNNDENSANAILNWFMNYLERVNPKIIIEEVNRRIIERELCLAFPLASDETILWFLHSEEGIDCILNHWVQSDLGRDRILIAMNDRKRNDGCIKMTNKRVWEKIANGFGLPEELVFYHFLEHPIPDVAHKIRAIDNRTWVPPDLEPCRDFLNEQPRADTEN